MASTSTSTSTQPTTQMASSSSPKSPSGSDPTPPPPPPPPLLASSSPTPSPPSSSPSSASHPPPSFTSAYLTSAATTVAFGSLGWTAGAGIVGSVTGLIRYDPHLPPVVLASRGARNAFIFAFPFYAIREYAISPLLYTLTDTHTSPSPSYASAHPYLHNVIATAVSGGSVGSIMAYAKGRSVPGNGAFFAALCASWQVAGNLLSAVRHRGDHHQSAESSKIPAETSSSSSSTPHPPTPSPPSSSWWEALKEAAPVRRIPDEEYAASLTKRQEELKEELRMLLQLEKEWEARSGKRQGESDGKSVDKARSV